MKAAVVRHLAERYGMNELAVGAEGIAEYGEDRLGVEGDDLGEKLTHLLLAMRIRTRVDAGEALKDAFRAEMANVREVLTNEG